MKSSRWTIIDVIRSERRRLVAVDNEITRGRHQLGVVLRVIRDIAHLRPATPNSARLICVENRKWRTCRHSDDADRGRDCTIHFPSQSRLHLRRGRGHSKQNGPLGKYLPYVIPLLKFAGVQAENWQHLWHNTMTVGLVMTSWLTWPLSTESLKCFINGDRRPTKLRWFSIIKVIRLCTVTASISKCITVTGPDKWHNYFQKFVPATTT